MGTVLITLLIVAGMIGLIALVIISIYNGLVRMRNKVKESWAGIDVQLKRRHDLVPNLVNTVKGYAAHEASVLEAVIKARSGAVQADGAGEAAAAEGMLGMALGKLFALSEAYPDLKANQNFMQLQVELAEIEDEVSASRRIYNGNVQIYNTKIQVFPNVLIAGPFGFKEEAFFEITNPEERETIKVEF